MDAPDRITYRKQDRQLELQWDHPLPMGIDKQCDRHRPRSDNLFELSIAAELLRVYSPSAEVRGHSKDQAVLQKGKKHVGISQIEAIGNYAIRLIFDDGHNSGIYTWEYLADLGVNQPKYFHEYEQELKKENASRLPTIPLTTATTINSKKSSTKVSGHWTPESDD